MSLLGLFVLVAIPTQANAQIFKIPHPDTTTGNAFGSSVSIDGDRALVGASAENICGPNSGAAYVFERDSTEGTWSQVARLTPRDCVIGDFFGRSLSISGDRAVVAASGSFPSRNSANAAYVFERQEDGAWREVSKITHKSDVEEGSFAASVSLDGERLLVATSGDPIRHEYSGAAYIYERKDEGTWVRKADSQAVAPKHMASLVGPEPLMEIMQLSQPPCITKKSRAPYTFLKEIQPRINGEKSNELVA